MELTESYRRVLPQPLLERFVFVEVRNAAATLAGTNPTEFQHIVQVLSQLRLTLDNLTTPGGNEGGIARGLNRAFRDLGWREAGHRTETTTTLRIEPFQEAGEVIAREISIDHQTEGHKVDNVRGRVALDVEWNAKDGNLDRDLANFRALHNAALIDVGVLITRDHERTKYAANVLAELSHRVRYSQVGKRIVLLGTTTTTNIGKLRPRLERGDAGGCPVLAVAITELSYLPGANDPILPPFAQPVDVEGVPDEPVEG